MPLRIQEEEQEYTSMLRAIAMRESELVPKHI